MADGPSKCLIGPVTKGRRSGIDVRVYNALMNVCPLGIERGSRVEDMRWEHIDWGRVARFSPGELMRLPGIGKKSAKFIINVIGANAQAASFFSTARNGDLISSVEANSPDLIKCREWQEIKRRLQGVLRNRSMVTFG